ncbi:MAG: hypothetical protein IH946_03410 [Bacteroidetes bacterium]|nr:hypothetical protein [Bacteroidota bacterium]
MIRQAILLLGIMIICLCRVEAQLISIDSARSLGPGTTINVRGIVTNGTGELSTLVRYFQDTTSGLVAFGAVLTTLERGDSIEITGELKDFNGLLEVDPIDTVIVLSTGNAVPQPKVSNLADGFTEPYEGMLMQFNGVYIPGATGAFASNNTYNISDGNVTKVLSTFGQPGNNSLIGSVVPTGSFTLIGLMGEFQGEHQIQPRNLDDIIITGPAIISVVTASDITTSGLTVNYTTGSDGSTVVAYGETITYELGTEIDTSMTTFHSIQLTGLSPATIYYIKAISVNMNGDSSSATAVVATASNSSGKIMVYFNNSVDTSFKAVNPAVYLNNTLADTLIAYMDRAQSTLDIAMYNLDNDNDLITAINDADSRGVAVRFIGNDGIDSSNYDLITIGDKVKSPTGSAPSGGTYGLMHNKLLIIDAEASDPNDCYVLSGSTNFTDLQVREDPNNLLIIQDQSLARAYALEFEEMYNGSFGPEKTDNTPHEFIIGGKRVESYFSPSDNVENKIKETIRTADEDLYFGVFSYTRFGLSYAIEDMVADSGVFAAGIIDVIDTTAIPFCIISLEILFLS